MFTQMKKELMNEISSDLNTKNGSKNLILSFKK